MHVAAAGGSRGASVGMVGVPGVFDAGASIEGVEIGGVMIVVGGSTGGSHAGAAQSGMGPVWARGPSISRRDITGMINTSSGTRISTFAHAGVVDAELIATKS